MIRQQANCIHRKWEAGFHVLKGIMEHCSGGVICQDAISFIGYNGKEECPARKV
jgi:hypothetical protein